MCRFNSLFFSVCVLKLGFTFLDAHNIDCFDRAAIHLQVKLSRVESATCQVV